MTPSIIVSYDDTANDRDALALGRLLADAGASISLAYVRHAQERDDEREAVEKLAASRLLANGAVAFGDPSVDRHVVVSASTGDGLRTLAMREGADAVVFGSDYRTAAGHVRPNRSVERLLHGGPVAVAIAPANLRERGDAIETIGVLSDDDDPAAHETAESLAEHLDATVRPATGSVDLLVVGSRPEAPRARVMLSAASEYAIETSASPVLVVPRGTALRFARPLVFA
jgi:nucleotide-binding universal stress UspA family protein